MSLNLADALEIAAEKRPDSEALVFDDTRMTFAQVAKAARRLAAALHERGVGPGDKVAFLIPNTPHFPIILYGVLYTGATAVPMNVLLQWREISYQLEEADVTTLFAFGPLQEQAVRAFQASPKCRRLFVVEPGTTPSSPETGESFLKMMASGSPDFEPYRTNPDDTAEILFTSAYGGKPLGTELTHFNLFQNALISQAFVQQFTSEDVCLCALPLFHSFGQTAMLNAPLLGTSKVILMPRFETHKVFEIIARERVTLFGVVPSMAHFMIHYKPSEHFDLSSIRALDVGGSALPLETHEAFLERFNIPLLQGYGLTETSPVVAYNVDEATNRPGSVGKPIFHCQVRIRRADDSFAAPGEAGEIVVRGHNVMKGYYKKPAETADALRDGWMHTGDLGYLDEDGYLYLTGLKKDLIIRAGMNIYPREIEEILLLHPDVEEAAVIGVPEHVRGEEVCAVLVSSSQTPPDEKALRAHCFEYLAQFKCPRKFEFIHALPRTNSGTIDKSALRRQFSRRHT
ncbi:MAG TPA: long-chain fatty acid--CoA ligase [Candidatus Hydrogenedentes bacterium]|nr:long-chain fatty acid--CoA ligase [Candidatus Hydrogenedentota bacterium]